MEQVPDSALVDGRPQGIFVGRSLLTGRAVCLLFLPDGRVTRKIPTGGLEAFDWARHSADHPGDNGRWSLDRGQLTISWGDGGVHQGPLTAHPSAIEFYGKRYARPATAAPADLIGTWESAAGTAPVGGPGINRLSTLVVEPGGRYRWADTVGGVVAGRAAVGGGATSGTLHINGQTITFRADDGTVAAGTFLPLDGPRIDAFSVDGQMFTRQG